MQKFIVQIILIVISIATFLVFIQPIYENISELRLKLTSYEEGQENATTLAKILDELTTKYNSISDKQKRRIEKLLPDNVDHIRLILEIQKIANSHGMPLKDARYEPKKQNVNDKREKGVAKGYVVSNLDFSVSGNYKDFLAFVKDLEKNLRVIDIASIQFSSDQNQNIGLKPNINSSEEYKYSFKIKTYSLEI